MKIYSPLEQFELTPILSFNFLGEILDFSITNSAYALLLSYILIFVILFFNVKIKLIPNFYQAIIELSYIFIIDIVKQQASKDAIKFFPIFYTIFMFILFNNYIGLIPFSFASTGQLVIPLLLSLTLNLGFILLGIKNHGANFVQLFIVKGISLPLTILIAIIEVVSYLLRPISLAVRLFANMMAGHTLLFILSSFVVSLFNAKFILLSVLPFFLLVPIFFLEVIICFLQAYVFVILSTIYLRDSLHIQH